MIGLTIDDMPVHILQDTGFEFYNENPFFTKSGDYTYDMDVDLNDPVNQVAYKHIDRLNSEGKPSGRKACLYDNSTIICYGTEIILKKEDSILKIQIVSGNSELNYFYAGKIKIRDLNFGTIPQPTVAYALSVVNSRYPEVNYVFPPILKSTSDSGCEFYNKITNFKKGELSYDSNIKMYPQPFFLYYVEKIIELVGYKLTYNCLLEEERWRRLIIVNGYDSLEYAKLLPDWTANEFITYCETFFNVVFLVDSVSKNVQIISTKKYYTEQAPIVLQQEEILDEFDRDYESDGEDLYIDYNNIEYNLPSTSYYQYAALDSEVLDKCTIQEAKFGSISPGGADWNNYLIFHDSDRQLYYVRKDSGVTLQQVMQYQSYISDKDGDTVSFKIVPSEIHIEVTTAYPDGSMYGESAYYFVPIPDYYENKTSGGFHEAVVSGIEDNASDIMKVAFYTGLVGLRHMAGGSYAWQTYNAPMCFCSDWELLNFTIFKIGGKEMVGEPQNATLTLCGPTGRAVVDFDNSITVDTSQEHIIRTITTKKLKPTCIYIINNRKFYCKSLKYTVENGEISKVIEGRFFPAS